jgi:hypothetical protein
MLENMSFPVSLHFKCYLAFPKKSAWYGMILPWKTWSYVPPNLYVPLNKNICKMHFLPMVNPHRDILDAQAVVLRVRCWRPMKVPWFVSTRTGSNGSDSYGESPFVIGTSSINATFFIAMLHYVYIHICVYICIYIYMCLYMYLYIYDYMVIRNKHVHKYIISKFVEMFIILPIFGGWLRGNV